MKLIYLAAMYWWVWSIPLTICGVIRLLFGMTGGVQ